MSSNLYMVLSCDLGTDTVLQDAEGCILDLGNVTISDPVIPPLDLGIDTSICEGQSLLLNAGLPGSTYLWSDGSAAQTLSVNTTGVYHVTLTDVDNCVNTDTIDVLVKYQFDATLAPAGPFCELDAPQLLIAADSLGFWVGGGIVCKT